jgi:hypothetical protein
LQQLLHTLQSGQFAQEITDGDTQIFGTCSLNNVDATNCYNLKLAMEQLNNSLRGSWLLVRAYNKVGNYFTLKRAHHWSPKSQMVPFIPPMTIIVEKEGYVDKKMQRL